MMGIWGDDYETQRIMGDLTDERGWEERQSDVVALHGDGAALALKEAAGVEVSCSTYCYGGSGTLNIDDTLYELASQGWRLVQVEKVECKVCQGSGAEGVWEGGAVGTCPTCLGGGYLPAPTPRAHSDRAAGQESGR